MFFLNKVCMLEFSVTQEVVSTAHTHARTHTHTRTHKLGHARLSTREIPEMEFRTHSTTC